MARLDSAITRMVARPRLTALTMLVLMARIGHRPSIWTTPVFCFQMPFQAISLWA
jgi:hypothetical protein